MALAAGPQITTFDWKHRLALTFRAGLGSLYTIAWTPLAFLLIGTGPFGLAAYAAAELGFAWVAGRKRHHLSTTGAHDLPLDNGLAWSALEDVLSGLKAMGQQPAAWLSTWCSGAPNSALQRENVAEMLAASVWGGRTRQQVRKAGYGNDLERMVDVVEAACQPERCRRPMASSFTLLPHDLDVPSPVAYPLISALSASSMSPSSSCSSLRGDATAVLQATPNLHDCADEDGWCTEAARVAPHTSSPTFTSFSPGFNPKVTFYNPRPEVLPHWYRPVLIYLAFEFAAWMNHNMLTWAGFKRHSQGSVDYYTRGLYEHPTPCPADARNPRASAAAGTAASSHSGGSARVPLLVMHGVGMGLLPYLKLLCTLASTGAPIIAVECKHVSQRWCGHVPGVEELRDDVQAIIARHTPQGVHVVAHSFGTLIAASLVRARVDLVHSLALLDPICFNLWMPSLLRNFIYRPLSIVQTPGSGDDASLSADPATAVAGAPATPTTPSKPAPATSATGWWGAVTRWAPQLPALRHPGCLMKDLLIMGPAREMHCTAALCRKLDWRTAGLRPQDLPAHGRNLVVLAEHDELLPAGVLGPWLQGTAPAHVQVLPKLRHADVLVAGWALDPLVNRIVRTAYGGTPDSRTEAGAR